MTIQALKKEGISMAGADIWLAVHVEGSLGAREQSSVEIANLA